MIIKITLFTLAATLAIAKAPHKHTPRNPLHAHKHHGTGYHPQGQRVQGNIQGHSYHHHGHDPDAVRKCPDPVEAAIHGSLQKLQAAIDCGVEVDETHKGGDTPLIIAAMGGHNAMVRLLLKNNAKTEHRNKGGNTALMRAAARGRYETCRILLDEGGADADAIDSHGNTAIMHAHIGHHESTERHLRKHIDEMRAKRKVAQNIVSDVKTSEEL